MSQSIFFERLSLKSRIGTGEDERRVPQRVLSSGTVRLEEVPWGNDSITKTLDYDRLVHEIASVSGQSEFCLLERLAEHLIDHMMDLFPEISHVTLALWKDPCPVPLDIERVGVTVEQDRRAWENIRTHAKLKERTS
jgi:FolB domain-containing protein